MTSVRLILLSGFLFLCINLSYAQWEQVSNGIGNQMVNALIINGSYMFAGTETNGVYVSTDNAVTWSQTTLTGNRVLCLAAAGSYLYAGTYTAGVYDFYYSSDYGTTWTQSSLNNMRISMLAVSGSTLFAAVGWGTSTSGVYFSNDNGVTWTQTSLHNFTVSVIADGNTLYAGTQNLTGGDILYRSNDLGTTWTPFLINRRIFSMYFGTGFMFAGYAGNNGGGICKSTDNGATWTTVLNAVHTYAFAGIGNSVFAGTHQYGAYQTSNNGTTWDIRNEGLPELRGIQDLKYCNNFVYAATQSGIWRNPNNYFTLFYDNGTYTGMNNWITNQGWGFTWAVTNGAFTDSPGKNNLIKNYVNNADNSMTLKNAINVSGYEYLKVSFTHKYLTQSGKDFCRVEVSADNGLTWAVAKNYSGTMDTMINDEIDITNLANKSTNMKIRFRLTSDSKIVKDGWYVTNIRVIYKTSNGNLHDNTVTNELPKNYLLGQNYPNPFNPKTIINYQLTMNSDVKLIVYDVMGREVITLVNQMQNAGKYEVEWDASNFSSGAYFYKITAGEYIDVKKMILLK